MVIDMTDVGRKEKKMEKEFIIIKMETFMMVSIKMIKNTVMEKQNCHHPNPVIVENGTKARFKGKEHISIIMEIVMKDSLLMDKKKEKENTSGKMVQHTQENGNRIK